MLNNVKKTFANDVMHADWMDNSSKHLTLKKIENLGAQLDYPEWILDDEKLDDYFSGVMNR